jgi:hypothetical protein
MATRLPPAEAPLAEVQDPLQSHTWGEFSRGTWATPSAKLSTVSRLVGTVSAIATGIKDFALS